MGGGMGGGAPAFDPTAMATMYQNLMKSMFHAILFPSASISSR
jgi:hypothetical protein